MSSRMMNQTDPKNQPQSHIAMESRSTNIYRPFVVEGNSNNNNKHVHQYSRHVRASSEGLSGSKGGYFSIESMLVLVGLTASLIILPLMLPTLPPPPLLLLMVPIGILGLLMVLAFMPSNVRDLTYM